MLLTRIRSRQLAGQIVALTLLGALICGPARAQSQTPDRAVEEPHPSVLAEETLEERQAREADADNPHLILQEGLSSAQQLVPVDDESAPGDTAVTSPDDDPVSEKPGDQQPSDASIEAGQEDAASRPLASGLQTAVDATDRVLDRTRRPLIRMQQKWPFFTNRNMLFFGRLEIDAVDYGSGVLRDDSGFDIRRLRLGVAGTVKVLDNWTYKLEFDLTDRESTLSDAYLAWHSERWGNVRLGNQRVAQTLSGQTSSVSISFMERPLPVLAFSLQRRIGIGWDSHWRRLGGTITVFGKDPNENIGSNGMAARFYFNPVRLGGDLVHLGVSFMDLNLDRDGRFRARPESNRTDIRLVDTGERINVKHQDALGLEVAGAYGSLTVKSEFYRAGWQRDVQEDAQFDGWYLETSWFLTGEKAHYRDGKFIRPTIRGATGAWEIAARYSSIDLNDIDVRGGEQQNAALAINWYSRTHWRLMANLIKVNADGPEGKQDPWIIQMRAQYFF